MHRVILRFSTFALGMAAVLGVSGCAMTLDGPPSVFRDQPPAVVDAEELVVLVEAGRAIEPMLQSVAERGYRLKEAINLDALSYRMVTLAIPPGVEGPKAIVEVEAIEPGAIAGLNHAFHTPPAERSTNPLRYADDMLQWPRAGCDATVPIGLIDTLVDADAPGLAEATVVAKSFVEAADADTRHGTDIATIIAAPNRLSNVALYSAGVVGETVEAGEAAGVDAIVEAIDWLAANDVRLVNISLAGPYNKILDGGLAAAAARGMVVVAAVGNAGADAPPLYPAAFDTVLAVTAVDVEANVYARAVHGEHVDLAAPGVDIFVDDQDRGHFATGTSIAAPFVTSRIAADASLARAPNVEAVKSALLAGARDLGAPGVDDVFGAGLVGAPKGCAVDVSGF